MTGYPAVTAVNAAGDRVARARATTVGYFAPPAKSPSAVVLAAGGSASSMVEATAVDLSTGQACTAYTALLVAVPGATTTWALPWPNDGCADLRVHPLVAGTTGI